MVERKILAQPDDKHVQNVRADLISIVTAEIADGGNGTGYIQTRFRLTPEEEKYLAGLKMNKQEKQAEFLRRMGYNKNNG
ncbi:hypothetical protein HZB00_01770 [Candidatus Woesearchaeota archaeon]|nr:hypothetical protein [Candidatus Woesearchaeota archaeon]